LKPNTPLVAERRLADEYGVSLGTARRATELLRDRGLVFTLRSKGTFIADPKVNPLGTGATVHSITAAQERRAWPGASESATPRSLAVDPAIEERCMAEGLTTFSPETTRPILDEACRTAKLDPRGATLIRLGENALYRLNSAPIVARIARDMDHWASADKEVKIARWLREVGFPAAEVYEVGSQPIETLGHPVTFWHFIPGSAAMPDDVRRLGRLLRGLHNLPFPGWFDLPTVDILSRVEPRVEKAPVPDADKEMLLDRCEELRNEIATLDFPLARTIIHGDAHIRNVMVNSDRAVLIDFENAAWGQPEWDLSMTATEYVTANWWSAGQYADFAESYGFDVTSWEGFPTLRVTHEIKMTTWIMQNVDQSPDIAAEYRRRIHTIRSGHVDQHWRPF
jgi:aminoglycoside phosphotransferase (APT) family kinase protein